MRAAGWASLLLALAPAGAWARQQAPGRPPPLQSLHSSADRAYTSLAFSPCGRWLAAGADGAVRILSADDDDAFAEAAALATRARADELVFDFWANALLVRPRGQEPILYDATSWAALRFGIDDLGTGGLAFRAGRQDKLDSGATCLPLPHRQRGLRLWNLQRLRADRCVQQQDLTSWKGLALGRVTALAWAESTLLAADDRGYVYRLPEARALMDRLDEAGLVLGDVARPRADGGRFRAHLAEVTGIGVALEAERCVTAGADGKVRLWDLRKIPAGRKDPPVKPEWEIPGLTAALSPDGALLAVAHDRATAVYHAGSGIRLSWNPTAGARAVRLRFDPYGERLAAILCRCAECRTGAATRRPIADHGGELVVWK